MYKTRSKRLQRIRRAGPRQDTPAPRAADWLVTTPSRAIWDAWENRRAVEGTVIEGNYGGFVVDIGGVRAFCPYGQYDADGSAPQARREQVGKTMRFRIVRVGQESVVVSVDARKRQVPMPPPDALMAALKRPSAMKRCVRCGVMVRGKNMARHFRRAHS